MAFLSFLESIAGEVNAANVESFVSLVEALAKLAESASNQPQPPAAN